MSVPVAPKITAPLSTGAKGPYHQKVKGPAALAATPGFYTPVPVASVLKGASLGVAYTETVSAQGGSSPYTFSLLSGSLPTGLSLSSSGTISGTPTATGTFSFTIKVTDTNGYTGQTSFQIIAAASASGGGSYVFIT